MLKNNEHLEVLPSLNSVFTCQMPRCGLLDMVCYACVAFIHVGLNTSRVFDTGWKPGIR